MEEKELYPAIKAFFQSQSYDVFGEVKDIDVVAKSGDNIVAIELKTSLNLELILQGSKRQRLTDDVFLAIPKPTGRMTRGKSFRDKLHLVKRLGLGLLYVDTSLNPNKVIVAFEPKLLDIKLSQQRFKKKRETLFKELEARHTDYNVGGSRGKIVTAYKEASLRILKTLEDGLPHTTKDIRHLSGIKKSTTILYRNHHGWYENVERGVYCISPQGEKALKEYALIIKSHQDV
ncbi:DUF2161 family putative PD-(D/E)XK-type phosphodiesterase [Petrocella sp. FN5]|uniref:DUF2161 family putative PD-(D/E)XK-type phosphodiesterase n=1 Tax=Petrocella sp. FN5 TaxID=3032002 RepID=UPI0023DA5D41|nr:DUF2161 family putative PD-(D/E)XK-type phosphodiesterase [Petrocella sp. FN5]MDF1617828.1 DUF2161 family putative PD-(D/E)XK-type phosphodiesterase [Petrocella sp. FN5]